MEAPDILRNDFASWVSLERFAFDSISKKIFWPFGWSFEVFAVSAGDRSILWLRGGKPTAAKVCTNAPMRTTNYRALITMAYYASVLLTSIPAPG
jgi:hypothetical protein